MSLFANRAPHFDSYIVTIPEGREPLYEFAAPVGISLALAAGGVWLARRSRINFTSRRVLLWLSAGGASIAYSGWWVWKHHESFIYRPNWYDWTAVSMPWLWTFATIVMIFRDYWAYGKEGKPKPPSDSATNTTTEARPES